MRHNYRLFKHPTVFCKVLLWRNSIPHTAFFIPTQKYWNHLHLSFHRSTSTHRHTTIKYNYRTHHYACHQNANFCTNAALRIQSDFTGNRDDRDAGTSHLTKSTDMLKEPTKSSKKEAWDTRVNQPITAIRST